MDNISPEQHGRKQRKGQMDAAGLKMLRWLSVTGNGCPPCSGNKMLKDLKWLGSHRQSVTVLALTVTCIHRKANTILVESPLSQRCDSGKLVSLRCMHNGVPNRSSAAKRKQQADLQTSREKVSELGWFSIFPSDSWMIATNRFPLTTWVVEAKVSCWLLKFTSVGFLWCLWSMSLWALLLVRQNSLKLLWLAFFTILWHLID